MKFFDISLESIRLNGKDVVTLILLAFAVFGLYNRFTAVETGLLELRISTLNMELAYMEGQERDEGDQRRYDIKVMLAKELVKDLEESQ